MIHNHTHTKRTDGHATPPAPESIKQVIGLIMFECGLEAISFDLAQRFGYSDTSVCKSHKQASESPSSVKYLSNPELNSISNAKMSYLKLPSLSLDNIDSQAFKAWKKEAKAPPTNREQATLKGDATNVALQIKAVWFNFAAPRSVREMRYAAKK